MVKRFGKNSSKHMDKSRGGLSILLTEYKECIKKILDSPQRSSEEIKRIVGRYCATFEGNFITWLAGALISCRSLQSKHAVELNLFDEIREDHPSMLRNFAKNVYAEPTKEDYQYVEMEVANVRTMIASLSGLKSIALLAFLENTSEVFIPHLAKLAKKLNATEFTYTEAHGVADIAHAQLFLEALSDEMNHDYQNPHEQMQGAFETGLNLLKRIFVPGN